MTAIMLRKPLFLPGVRDCEMPAALMNSGSTAPICSGVHPERPRTSNATRPLVRRPSESPTKDTVPSPPPSSVAST